MTSLDGPGFSITLLKATPEMVGYIDTPTDATGWSAPSFPPGLWEEKVFRLFESGNSSDKELVVQDAGIECKLFALSLQYFETEPNQCVLQWIFRCLKKKSL